MVFNATFNNVANKTIDSRKSKYTTVYIFCRLLLWKPSLFILHKTLFSYRRLYGIFIDMVPV